MSTRTTLPRSARRGYAMVLVLVFLALMLAMITVSQRRLDSVMRVESSFAQAAMRGARAHAMGKALDALWTGPPPSDPYVCATTVETSEGPQSFTVTFDRTGRDHWVVRVEPTAPDEDPPPLPSSFAN